MKNPGGTPDYLVDQRLRAQQKIAEKASLNNRAISKGPLQMTLRHAGVVGDAQHPAREALGHHLAQQHIGQVLDDDAPQIIPTVPYDP
jgi:hypothetical protein